MSHQTQARITEASPFLEAPFIVVEQRRESCACDCEVDFSDPCASCPQGKWGKFYCYERTEPPAIEEDPLNAKQPTLTAMAQSAASAAINWTRGKFKLTDPNILSMRYRACRSCEFWDAKAIGATGRCMKCGCSTWAKLRMATEKCPIGKW
jgi:hypothetical protein